MKNNLTYRTETENPGLASDRAALWIYLMSFVPVLLLALLAPDSVLSAFPALNEYTQILRDIFPAIDRLASVSAFPEVTRLVLSLEWTLLPLQALLYFIFVSRSVNFTLWRERRTFIAIGLPILLGLFVWGTAIFFEVNPSDLQGQMKSERMLRLVSTSRLGLAVASSLVMTSTALVIGGFFSGYDISAVFILTTRGIRRDDRHS